MTESARLHIVMVPGFAGFDALGQLEYYAGVTDAYRTWLATRGAADSEVVLHYFANLPTAGVSTRAEWLRTYLAKRIARGEIQGKDRVALVGHSTGGLDIRRLLFSAGAEDERELLRVDGGEEATATVGTTRDGRGRSRTAVTVQQEQILQRVDRVVFLSVPQRGTNIADWTRRHRLLRQAAVRQLRWSVEGARLPQVDQALSGILGQVGRLDHDPDLVLAAQDALRETKAAPDDPLARAAAEEAGSQLRLWLQHAADDFSAIDDLAAEPLPQSDSPAHHDDADRDRERALWEAHAIRTMSVATISRRPFRLQPGRPAPPLTLTDPRTWPNRDLAPGADTTTDISYLIAYRACAGGPLDRADADPAAPPGTIADLDISMFDAQRLGPDGPSTGDPLEVWDNDGIVNTASMLWPDGPRTRLVAADHGDIIGHYVRRPGSAALPTRRRYASYDLLRSGTGFTDKDFQAVWEAVFDFCVS